MKKLYVFFILSLAVTVVASSQDYNKFKVGLGLGLSLSGDIGYGIESGIFLTIEPAYPISDDLAIGFRIEGAANRLDLADLYWIGISSITVNSQFYFIKSGRIRPFVGLGLGTYFSSDFYRTGSLVGFYPRIGFDDGHFSMVLDYNILPTSGLISHNEYHYFGIRIGGYIGGGKKVSSQATE